MDNNKKIKEKSIEEIAKIWCFHNDIKAYAVPINNTKLRLEINYKGKIIKGTKVYYSTGGKTKDDKWWLEIEKIYIAYYNKHNSP